MDWATHEHVAPALRDKPVAFVEPDASGGAAESLSYLRDALAAGGAQVETSVDEPLIEMGPAVVQRDVAGPRHQPVAVALAAITRRACPA